MLVMMCARTPALNTTASREDITLALRNQRLASFADSYLEQLKSEADITER
jgi:peptidyl-prolyl cis-trans isomerase SurA